MAALRLAALDVGSNSIHVTVGRVPKNRVEVIRLADEADLVRLGADVTAYGEIGPERMARAIVTIRDHAELARLYGAQVVLGVATEGVRRAANGAAFLARVRRETGVLLELVTGAQEAALTYWGATSGLKPIKGRRAVLDMGGGSLEFVVGRGRTIDWRVSLPLGSGAMRQRYAPSDPPSPEELEAVRRVVVETLTPLDPPLPVAEAIVCGGTAMSLAMLGGRITVPDELSGEAGPPKRNRYLTRAQLEAVLALLETTPSATICHRFGVEEGRARLLAAGAAVLLAAMDELRLDVLRARRRGVREGAILTYAHVGERWLEAAEKGEIW